MALYTGLPYEITGDLYLPKRAVEMLISRAVLTPEQIAYLDAHAIILEGMAAPAPQTEEHTEYESTDRILKGKTTFQEVLDWGVSQEIIESILGTPMPNPLTKVKDYCFEQGLNFEEIKSAIQAEIDKVAP